MFKLIIFSFDRLLADIADQPGTLRRRIAHRHVETSLYPALHRLAALCPRLALVTNNEARDTHLLLKSIGLEYFFNPIVTRDLLGRPKPHRGLVDYCMLSHQVDPTDTLLVGDLRIDIAMAGAAGLRMWFLPYAGDRAASSAAEGTSRVISCASAICDAIETASAAR